jgi:hypothetical protein
MRAIKAAFFFQIRRGPRTSTLESSYTAGTGYIITYALWKMVFYM